MQVFKKFSTAQKHANGDDILRVGKFYFVGAHPLTDIALLIQEPASDIYAVGPRMMVKNLSGQDVRNPHEPL